MIDHKVKMTNQQMDKQIDTKYLGISMSAFEKINRALKNLRKYLRTYGYL